MDFFVIFLIMLLAGLVQGSCGFGAGLVAMSIMPFLMPYKTALPLMYVSAVFLCLRLLLSMHRSINWKILALPTLFSLLGRVAGLYLFISFDNTELSRILGATIMAIALYQLLYKGKIKIRPTPLNGSVTGIISGILGGVASSSGPPLVVYYMNADLEKTEFIATIQMTFLIGSLFSISLLAASGGYTGEIWSLAIAAVAGVLLGSSAGLRLFHAINRDWLYRIINLVLLATGLSLVVKSLF